MSFYLTNYQKKEKIFWIDRNTSLVLQQQCQTGGRKLIEQILSTKKKKPTSFELVLTSWHPVKKKGYNKQRWIFTCESKASTELHFRLTRRNLWPFQTLLHRPGQIPFRLIRLVVEHLLTFSEKKNMTVVVVIVVVLRRQKINQLISCHYKKRIEKKRERKFTDFSFSVETGKMPRFDSQSTNQNRRRSSYSV